MKYLPEDPHTFTLSDLMTEHKYRLIEPPHIYDSTTTETPASIIARLKTYEAYEICDFSLSLLAIEALVHPDLRADAVVQFSHEEFFKKLPGSVYLMMVLDVCHAFLVLIIITH